jgi:hypothetical protein
MKKYIALGITLLFILVALVGCNNSSAADNPSTTPDNSQEAPVAPNALVPSIMIEDTLYLMSQKEKPVIEIAESEYSGIVMSTVSLSEWPTENGQANIDVEGAPYAEYENGFVVLWNGEWTLFLTEQERLSEIE